MPKRAFVEQCLVENLERAQAVVPDDPLPREALEDGRSRGWGVACRGLHEPLHRYFDRHGEELHRGGVSKWEVLFAVLMLQKPPHPSEGWFEIE